MSTGEFEPGSSPNLMQFSGDNLPRNDRREADLYQFNDGPSNLQSEGWDIPRGQTRNYAFPTDGQGYPVINNYGGTVNVFMAGGNSYSDAACRAAQARKLADMTSGRYDNYDDSGREQWGPEYNRLSDFRREALIRDGQRQDQMYRANFNRDFDNRAYYRNGQHTSYSHGGRDGLSYYESGPSYRSSLPPWVNDDCFGTGRNGGNGDLRAFQDMFRTVAPFIVSMRHADNRNDRYDGRYDGRWDRGRDYRDGGMNQMDYMLMDRAINGGRWNRNPRVFDENVAYSRGGRDGLTYYNSTPTYDQWSGPRSGFEEFAGNVMPIFRDVAPFIVAMKYANDDGSYRGGNHNVDNYYDNGHRSQQMAYNRELHDQRARRDAERVQRNRERAMMRREYGYG